jgi:hypothetical protein
MNLWRCTHIDQGRFDQVPPFKVEAALDLENGLAAEEVRSTIS